MQYFDKVFSEKPGTLCHISKFYKLSVPVLNIPMLYAQSASLHNRHDAEMSLFSSCSPGAEQQLAILLFLFLDHLFSIIQKPLTSMF